MKALQRLSLSVLLVALFMSYMPTTEAQDGDKSEVPVYVEISYMKTKNADYVKMEQELWKPVHQARVGDGSLLWWGLYSVMSPYGSETKYDYATVNVYRGIGSALGEDEGNGVMAAFDKIHMGKDMDALFDRTDASRDLVWSNVFRVLDHAVPIEGDPGKYLVVNGMNVKPGMGAKYVKMERDIFMPSHKAAVEAGVRKNWHLLARTTPYGSRYKANYLTMDEYDSISNHYKPLPEGLWEKAHPGKDIDFLFDHLDVEGIRDLTTSHIWKLVDYTEAQDEQTKE